MDVPSLHIAMYPWYAMGHLTANLHLANKLARRGHRISLFVPNATQSKLQQFNLYPHLITFVPITVPHVEGLPCGAETTSDVPSSLFPLLMTAMDQTQDTVESLLQHLKPAFVFFEFAYWIPNLTHKLGIKSIQYWTMSPVTISYLLTREGSNMNEHDLMNPPPGFLDSAITLHVHEARSASILMNRKFGGISFFDRAAIGLRLCDAAAYRGCREVEGPYIEFLESFGRPVLLQGPNIPEPPYSTLDENMAKWLEKFEAKSVIYCAFGSECILKEDQFKDLLLGLELTNMPFLAALKAPTESESIEAALPEGFKERVEGRGIAYGGWVQQQLILEHPSVGCFITHCGSGSLIEALVNRCELVFLPNIVDQSLKAKMLGRSLRVGVEVEKDEEEGYFTKESVCKAVRTVMDHENGMGREIRANRAKLREVLLRNDLENSYIGIFCKNLQELAG